MTQEDKDNNAISALIAGINKNGNALLSFMIRNIPMMVTKANTGDEKKLELRALSRLLNETDKADSMLVRKIVGGLVNGAMLKTKIDGANKVFTLIFNKDCQINPERFAVVSQLANDGASFRHATVQEAAIANAKPKADKKARDAESLAKSVIAAMQKNGVGQIDFLRAFNSLLIVKKPEPTAQSVAAEKQMKAEKYMADKEAAEIEAEESIIDSSVIASESGDFANVASLPAKPAKVRAAKVKQAIAA
jgi:hypothetical protein